MLLVLKDDNTISDRYQFLSTHRVTEANDIDALLEHIISQLGGESGIADHDWSNRVISVKRVTVQTQRLESMRGVTLRKDP